MKEFRTAQGFAAHLTRIAAEVVAAEARGMDSAAAVIQREAKHELGTYQRDDTGPFEPWAELKDVTKLDRVRQGFTANDPGLRDGEMRDSIHRAVALPVAVVCSNDDKLVWFELGTKHQPPRSVLGVAAHRKGLEAAERVGVHVAWTVAGLPTRND